MRAWCLCCWAVLGALLWCGSAAAQQTPGSIRGVVRDQDFDAPLPEAEVTAVETGQVARTGDQGNYLLGGLAPGRYTLVFQKEGYVRQVKVDVLVGSGQLTQVDASLPGEFVDMEEFLVEDVLLGGAGTEAALLQLRLESPALLDSISADLMSRAGASDAASALRLVAGASVQDGKYAVIRGLPDRYVSSQMNGVRLPTADEDKRAVELDQFPSAVIESIQVSKTFTPDQQGDASGGAVDVRLKGIPSESTLQLKVQSSTNSQVTGRDDFLSYDGGGVSTWGSADRGVPEPDPSGSWDGAVGTERTDAPDDTKLSGGWGGKRELENGWTIGGFASLFYERDSSFYDNGIDDSLWVEDAGGPMVPKTFQGTPSDGNFRTGLFDVTQGSQSVQWGGLGTFGVESESHALGLTYLYTHSAEDTATLAEDTRGKYHFFPDYDPDDPDSPGNGANDLLAAPFLRIETLTYTERTTSTLQLDGRHTLPVADFALGDAFEFHAPEVDWVVADSSAELDQPDKRQFAALWVNAESAGLGELWLPYKPGANYNFGNLQRIWKTIDEESRQYATNVKLPFDQWSGEPGYLKVGVFDDSVERRFDQDTFSNFGDSGAFYEGGWDDPWSDHFDDEDHPVFASEVDVDYFGEQDVSAVYSMVDLPLSESWNLIGGARFEATGIEIVNDPEEDALWFPPGSNAGVKLNPGDADVSLEQDDALPAVALVYEPVEELTLRAAYSQTIARPNFKELTPIIQQEYLGGPIFIGNPDLGLSSVDNYDLRADWRPYGGALVSLSWFRKEIEDPIEYVQRYVGFDFTTAVNYPEGELDRYEIEVRQDLGHFWDALEGLGVGANATFIASEVTLPEDESAGFDLPGIDAPISSRDMTNAPEYLYNLFLTYDWEHTGTQVGLFYTVQGDTLVAGATQSAGNFVPSVYATEYDTLNLSVTQRLGPYFSLVLQAKNLTNAPYETVYRSEYIGDDVRKTYYTKGIEYSLALGFSVGF